MAGPEQPMRPRTADPSTRHSFLGTKRSFPLVGRKRNKSSFFSRPSTALSQNVSSPSLSLSNPGLRVHLWVKFAPPTESKHLEEIQGSSNFVPSEQQCQALLHRLQHCTAELITRWDCGALDPLRQTPQSISAKPMRYQLTFRIERNGHCYADQTFTSYQDEVVTESFKRILIHEARLMVSLFLQRHDPGFRWVDEMQPEAPEAPEQNRRSSLESPLSTNCIPRDNFGPRFGHNPGYLVEVFLRSRSSGGEDRSTSFKINSLQTTPLTLLLGEDLLSKSSNILDEAFEARRLQFEAEHELFDDYDDDDDCPRVVDGAFDALIKIRNTFGPSHAHLSRRLQSSRVVFDHTSPLDFREFAAQLQAQLENARDSLDHRLEDLDDLVFRIRRIQGHGREIRNALTVSLDSSVTNYRRVVEAILERVQAGIKHVLAGSGASVKLTAHKRGHLVLDTLISSQKLASDGDAAETWPDLDFLLSKLRDRIRTDIIMLCKDTCSLETSELLPNLTIMDAKSSLFMKQRQSSYNSRPSTPNNAPSTPSRQSISKKHALGNLRALSLSSPRPKPSNADLIEAHGYMAGIISDENYLSDAPSTPSLVDTDSVSPHESMLVTPESSRVSAHNSAGFGVLCMSESQQEPFELASHAVDAPRALGPRPLDAILDSSGKQPFGTPTSNSSEAVDLITPTTELQLSEQSAAGETPSAQPLRSSDGQVQTSHAQGAEIVCELESNTRAGTVPKYNEPILLQEHPVAHPDINTSADADHEGTQANPEEQLEIVGAVVPVASRNATEAPSSSSGSAVVQLEGKDTTGKDEVSSASDEIVDPSSITAGLTTAPELAHDRQPLEKQEKMDSYFPDVLEEETPILPTQLDKGVACSRSSEALVTRARSDSLQAILALHRQRSRSIVIRPKSPWLRARPQRHARVLSSPTAGYLGLGEERFNEVGLMSAIIPPYLRVLRRAGHQ
ncbi:hypothetical protein S40293_09179 [Stachybotrys chartarum IBT 40293]|nr:hypothetical protein S40293_09179 [Stachybotrys chartarum IBT 40293]